MITIFKYTIFYDKYFILYIISFKPPSDKNQVLLQFEEEKEEKEREEFKLLSRFPDFQTFQIFQTFQTFQTLVIIINKHE